MLDLENVNVLETGDYKGYKYLIASHPAGFRLGYVALPKSHPWHGLTWFDTIDVHGGLSYVGAGTSGEWWIGFSCDEPGDAPDNTLNILSDNAHKPGVVRTQEWVRNELHILIDQVQSASKVKRKPRKSKVVIEELK
jgi:hypothetical protein